MHLYDDIGDASSSLRGSTSSFNPALIRNMLVWCYKFICLSGGVESSSDSEEFVGFDASAAPGTGPPQKQG